MSAKLIHIIALAGLTVLAGAAASTFTIDDAQAAAAGGPRGGGPNGGGGQPGGGGGGGGNGGEKNDDRSGPEALPIFAFNPNCLTAAILCRPPKLPPVIKKAVKEDHCGGYRLPRLTSDPVIYDPWWRCERKP